MAGQTVTADQALHIGLVHAVFSGETFQDRVQAFAAELCDLPREAVGLSKLAIDATASVDRGVARDIERLANSSIIFGQAFQAQLAAFSARKGAGAAQAAPGETP